MDSLGKEIVPPAPATGKKQRASLARSRGALLWGLGTFVLLQLTLLAAMQTWLPHWADAGYGSKIVRLQRRLSAAQQRPLLVVALGSSRTHFGLKGGPAEQALHRALGQRVLVSNFGRPGGGAVTDWLSLRRILADVGGPDLVLVEILPTGLACRVWPADVDEGRLPTTGLRRDELRTLESYSGGVRRGLRREWWLA